LVSGPYAGGGRWVFPLWYPGFFFFFPLNFLLSQIRHVMGTLPWMESGSNNASPRGCHLVAFHLLGTFFWPWVFPTPPGLVPPPSGSGAVPPQQAFNGPFNSPFFFVPVFFLFLSVELHGNDYSFGGRPPPKHFFGPFLVVLNPCTALGGNPLLVLVSLPSPCFFSGGWVVPLFP